MALNAAKKQLVVALENVAGTAPAAAFTTAANANILLLSGEPTLDVEQFDKDYLRTSLTRLKQGVGQKAGGVTAEFELAGTTLGTFAAGPPAWSKLVEMAGFRRYQINRANLTGTFTGTGPFRKGEVVNDGAADFTVAMDTHDGTSIMYFLDNASATMASTGTLTASDTGTTVAIDSAPTDEAGWVWWPVSEIVKSFLDDTTVSGTTVVGDVYTGDAGAVIVIAEATTMSTGGTVIFRPGSDGGIGDNEVFTRVSGTGPAQLDAHVTAPAETFLEWPTGAIRFNEDGVALDFLGSRGNISFEFTVNRPVSVTTTTRGRWDAVTDVPFIAGASPDVVDAPLWAGLAVGMALNEDAAWDAIADEVNPCLKSLSLDLGIQLADRQCAGATDGLQEIIGTGRDATGSLTADATFEAFFPWLGKLRDGDVIRLEVPVGSVAGNKFVFQMPGIQETGASSGDQDGILTRDISFNMTGGVNANVTTPTNIAQAGADNELIFILLVV